MNIESLMRATAAHRTVLRRQGISWFFTGCVCLVSAGQAASQGTDQRAGYLQMLEANGPKNKGLAELSGGDAPILGRPTSFRVVAPGYTHAICFMAAKASSGFVIPFSSPLTIYVDPASILFSLPKVLTGGVGELSFALPPARALLGLDLAVQGLVLAIGHPNLPLQVGTTGLLAANLGSSAALGTMIINFPLKGTAGQGTSNPNGPDGWLRGWGGGHKVGDLITFKNPFNTNVWVCMTATVRVLRGACRKPLIIHDGGPGRTGTRLATIPVKDGKYERCFCLARKGSVYVFNPNPATNPAPCLMEVTIAPIEFQGPCK